MTGESGASSAGGAPAAAVTVVEEFVEVDSPAVPHDEIPPMQAMEAARRNTFVVEIRTPILPKCFLR